MSNDLDPSLLTRRALYPLMAVLSGCALFGGGARSGPTLPVEATDSAQAYRDYLAIHGDEPSAERYRQRMAELELVQARTQLRPVLDPQASFSAEPGGPALGSLARGTQMIFEQADDGWIGFQVIRVAPDLDAHKTVRLFARAGEPVSLETGEGKRGTYFSVEEPAGIPLVRSASFGASLTQQYEFGGGLSFCFFSTSPDSCEDGYVFTYDKAHFQAYQLARRSGGQSTSLCSYQMDPNNTQHSDSITVDHGSGQAQLRDPRIDIAAHHGYVTVHFNGQQICHVKDDVFTEGYFVIADAPAITQLSIDLNAGSSIVFAPADTLVDIQATSGPLSSRSGPNNDAYNAFAVDYNAYLAVVAGGDFPERFTNSYFNTFFDMGEADEAYAAIEGSQKMADYVAYLEAYPRNSHKRQIEKTLLDLARELDTLEAYQTFQDQYPDSVARLGTRRRIADLQWSQTVKKLRKKDLDKYLSTYPAGYYAARAQRLLEGLAYAAQNKAEVTEARKVLKQARTLVNKSPVTARWDVEVVDYQNGSVYFNLNNGPVVAKNAGAIEALNFVVHEQTNAHHHTCDLLKKNIPLIGFCLVLFSKDHVSPKKPFPVEEAIQDALDGLYLSRIERGESVHMTRVLELLDTMAQGSKGMEFTQWAFLAQTYGSLGMLNEATYTLYTYALTGGRRSDVSYMAKKMLEKAPSLAQDPDFQWVLERFGE